MKRMWIVFVFLFLWHPNIQANLLKQANESYQKGVQGKTILDQEQAFNQALTLYSELEKSNENPSSELYQAVADSYYQLGEYSWAILYYYKGLKVDPRNRILKKRLEMIHQELGLENKVGQSSAWEKFLLIPYLSMGEKRELLLMLVILTSILVSIYIWTPFDYLKKPTIFVISLTILLLINIVITFYFSPIEGVLVQSTGYYRGPNENQSRIRFTTPTNGDNPDDLLKGSNHSESNFKGPPPLPQGMIRSGTKLRLLSIDDKGRWLKTENPDGLIGYVPTSVIRAI